MIINQSTRFKRSFKKLPFHIQKSFFERVRFFAENPFHPRLETHKLKGKLNECYAFCLKDGFRVYFDFAKSDEVNLLYIGPHDHYARWR